MVPMQDFSFSVSAPMNLLRRRDSTGHRRVCIYCFCAVATGSVFGLGGLDWDTLNGAAGLYFSQQTRLPTALRMKSPSAPDISRIFVSDFDTQVSKC